MSEGKGKTFLFVHFKEKRTPDGEQVYFAVSKDGFNWEQVNNGNPVLWSYEGDKGVRDFTVYRKKKGGFVILATDLSLAYGWRYQYKQNWKEISLNGSKDLVMWESDDLIHWSKQRMLHLGNEDFGCLWAPDIIYDEKEDDYVIHWSSSHRKNNFGAKGIFYTRTKDFVDFTPAAELYRKSEDSPVIDSAMYEENGKYYMFIKCEYNPARILLLKSDNITGPFEKVEAFDDSMSKIQEGKYEAPTAFRLADGRWCLMLDFYGADATGQGYIPFIADTLGSGHFVRSDASFSFPYGFKHGTVLEITMEEYNRLKSFEKNPNDI